MADPPRAEEATTCPRCGAPLAPDQEWCVECGTAARTRIVPPPSWRGPVVLVAILITLAGAGLAAAFVEATHQGPGALRPPATAAASTRAPAAPAPATPPSPTTTVPSNATTPPATGQAKLQTWPRGLAAYTVVLLSTPDKKTARTTARGLAATGLVGLARSSDFNGLPAGSWLVFTGNYATRQQAEAAAAAAKTHGATAATVQHLKPKR